MKPEDYRQGPFVNGNEKPSGGPFVGGRGRRRTPTPQVTPRPSGRAPEDRPGPKRRSFVRHALLAIAVAGLIAVVRAGVETSKDIDLPDFSNLPTISSNEGGSTRDSFSASDRPDRSEDPNLEESSQIVTVDAVRGDTVQVSTILGRELTWQISCPAVRRAIVAATGEKPILSWERTAAGDVTVVRVLHDGDFVRCD